MAQIRSSGRLRHAAAIAACAVVVLSGASAAAATAAQRVAPHAAGKASPHAAQYYDARVGADAAAKKSLQRRAAEASARTQVTAMRTSLGDQAVVDIDGLTGTPRQVARLDGFLTGPSTGRAADIAMGYVRQHVTAFGMSPADLSTLQPSRDYVDVAGIHHVSFAQRIGGLLVFGNGVKANVTRDGRLISVQGSPVAGQAAPAAATRAAVGSGAQAISRARADLGEQRTAAGPADTAQPVLFLTSAGLRRAWVTITMSAAHPAQHVIDATGRVLYRRSLGSDAGTAAAAPSQSAGATGVAYVYFPAAAHGGTQVPQDFTARGWLAPAANKLSGNNTHTYADENDSNVPEPKEEIPPRQGNSWNYPLVPFHLPNVSFCDNPSPCSWDPNTPFSWRTNRNQNATQVFSFVNNWHDYLATAPIGFTEAAGNFQKKNSSSHGKGGDAVEAQSDDGANTDHGLPDGNHVDNANMNTPPDGTPPTMQMFLQHQPHTTYPAGDPFSPTNVGDEADTVYHEYTHGLSNRLVVDSGGNSTLGNVQAGSMGEAWSDWYAMDYLVAQHLQTETPADGDIVMFQYDGAGVALDRTEPVDCSVGSKSPKCRGTVGAGRGGYTYGDFGKVRGRPEVHSDGEIWAQTLWDLRAALGSKLSESLVTRAMELSPANPSFLDMRNSILQADTAVNGGHARAQVWKVFAHRGMGFFAAAANGDDATPVEDFSLPPAPGTPKGSLTGKVADDATGAGIAGATVAFGGHASGFAGSYATTTTADGTYTISGIIQGTYAKVSASGAGFDGRVKTVSVAPRVNVLDWSLRRDWAAPSGGGAVTNSNGEESASFGCGSAAMIDQSQGSGWSTNRVVTGGAVTPKFMVIKLPVAVNVSEIAIDPTGSCGDDATASTGPYTLETSTNGTTWTVASAGTFTPADRGRFNSPTLTGTAGVRFIRYTMKDSQAVAEGHCAGGTSDASGCDFIDSTELEVYGSPTP
ncbi:MAG: hypothetical protein DLM59_19915 [Pseudonocardiales bacterium]|nr:MAG: hypothetical protein DLM59_19915 [Pseudonocardiales bacterium]